MQIYSKKIHKEYIGLEEDDMEDTNFRARIKELSINPAKPTDSGVATALH